ncbi:hypothetical protein [Dietzia psychralcaliphila]|uniref:hypothetical protein n=1 Tax=Dietzia psychralcaliphila TaxID=139021 RepID=UPI000D4A3023|nr:hypothetical protein [Dietzia psychralcaliphila]PTM90485.1 hypothetical protein C8N39_101238 [Dietzia psychralcaliphila]
MRQSRRNPAPRNPAPGNPAPRNPAPSDPVHGDPATFCEAPAAYIVETYFVLRMVIAAGALILPATLLLWVALDSGVSMMGSLSAFYYSPARSLFVGILVAIGVALVAYRGYTRGENALLNGAGVLSIVVALVPTGDSSLPGLTVAGAVHAVAAVGFFVLAALSIFFYGQETLGSLSDPDQQRRYRAVYRVLAVLVVAFPGAAVLVAWVVGPSVALFAGEAAALYAFAAFWLVKTYELSQSHAELRIV